MELWLDAEIRIRRDDALENGRRSSASRLAASGRTPTIRDRVANGAQTISDALAAFARSMRNGEAV